jgi:hypothetical protein
MRTTVDGGAVMRFYGGRGAKYKEITNFVDNQKFIPGPLTVGTFE